MKFATNVLTLAIKVKITSSNVIIKHTLAFSMKCSQFCENGSKEVTEGQFNILNRLGFTHDLELDQQVSTRGHFQN